jgi:3-deoxy-D-manno-octulosonic-acid transferase
MLGLVRRPADFPGANGCLWIHAVSVGEVGAARAVLPLLRETWPHLPVLVTTVTETGQATARRQLQGLAEEFAYWPADFTWVVSRFFDHYRPRLLVVMETELWPNVLTEAARRGVPVVTMNGKISRRSFPRYRQWGWLLGDAFRSVRGWCVQTEGDAERVATLTGLPWPTSDGPIRVTGNMKFDLSVTKPSANEIEELRVHMGLAAEDRCVVIGSTHPGEEQALLQTLLVPMTKRLDTVVILVPRHPERFASVWEWLMGSGWKARRWSDGRVHGAEGPRLVLVDAMGQLLRLYALAEVAIVAGSFVGGIGGHNVLEPAALGRPVVFGPDMKGQPDMAKALLEAEGCVQCGAEELGPVVDDLLTDAEKARALGERGRHAVEANRGAARKSVDHARQVAGPLTQEVRA